VWLVRKSHTSVLHVMLKAINQVVSESLPMSHEHDFKARCFWTAFTTMLTLGALQSVQIAGTAANFEEPPKLRIPVCQEAEGCASEA
jgi:uncharacterized membrane protein